MVRIEQLAEAAINQDALALRGLTQDLLRERPTLKDFPRPTAGDFKTLAAAAALIERGCFNSRGGCFARGILRSVAPGAQPRTLD